MEAETCLGWSIKGPKAEKCRQAGKLLEKWTETIRSHTGEDISNKAGFSRDGGGISHKFTMTIFALPTRKGSSWQNSESQALRECGKENQTLRRVSFLVFSSFQA